MATGNVCIILYISDGAFDVDFVRLLIYWNPSIVVIKIALCNIMTLEKAVLHDAVHLFNIASSKLHELDTARAVF